jgi:ketosteroid isomerase-like protein
VIGESRARTATALSLLFMALACAGDAPGAGAPVGATQGDMHTANVGIDALNARLAASYHDRDPRAYAALYTDSGRFEWPATATVRGRAGLESMARELWPALPDLQLKVIVGSRHIAPDHATEFGAFEESWRDSSGGRTTEYGRYVALLARQRDSSWLLDRWFGFEDSTRRAAPLR